MAQERLTRHNIEYGPHRGLSHCQRPGLWGVTLLAGLQRSSRNRWRVDCRVAGSYRAFAVFLRKAWASP